MNIFLDQGTAVSGFAESNPESRNLQRVQQVSRGRSPSRAEMKGVKNFRFDAEGGDAGFAARSAAIPGAAFYRSFDYAH